MIENRLREWFAEAELAGTAGATEAFVPCPCPILNHFNPGQLAFVAEVYRIAREMVEAQLREPVRSWIPEFSRN